MLVGSWGQPATLLHEGRADVALLRSPFSARGLEVEELLSEPRVVALAVGHRLAGRSRLRRADLAAEAMPRWPGADEVMAAHWTGRDPASLPAAWPDGVGPPAEVSGPLVSDPDQLLTVVALGQAVAFVPASTAGRHSRTDVVYRPVTDLSPSVVAVVWPEGSRHQAVAAFVRATAQVATHHPDLLGTLP